ncbi:NACHT domain-containing protein [Pseudomonas batumici]|uniref:NACHT domain-containing protein n=1 Tax=Pseudomonas batumici TaxID=226910 RepID=UPI0030D2E2C5
MAESGGPTTQSGIYYQNTITALYLGSLLDARPPTNRGSRITSVRVEAPEDIDDTVVHYADGSTLYIQAKEQLSLHGEAWIKFWSSAKQQFAKCRSDRDQFLLVLGTLGLALENLRETLERAQGKENFQEWQNALNQEQLKISGLIVNALSVPNDEAFAVIKRTRAEIIPLDIAETTRARDWMPNASEKPTALLSRLRDCCGGAARIRHTFRASELPETLFSKFNLRIFGTHNDGLEKYCNTIATQVDHIGVPGTAISLHQDDLFLWPTVVPLAEAVHSSFEDEDPWINHHHTTDEIDLSEFPSQEMGLIILESGAGYGKSTILRATARRLATKSSFVPALMHAEVLPEHPTIQDYLNDTYNSRYQVSIDWTTLCEQGRAVLLIDGVDELNDGARAALINMIERAVARFPDTPILIGARDASVTSFPPQFKIFRVQRLDYDQMVTMLETYLRARGEINIQSKIQHVHAYEELSSLCRIPLFLAIFASTLPKSGTVPTSRAEVLELYIQNALSPERHKGVIKSKISKTQLRCGSEAIASLSLERNEAAVPDSLIRTCLSKKLGDPTGDDCIDTLVQNGILERRGSRLAFSIPTIQEYLAGCVLADTGRLNAEDWIENVYRRPWAQAIQFAVEKIDNADTLLRRQIEHEDDIFHTSLRLAARCVTNGATVSKDLKDTIASKLASALKSGGFQTSTQISNLIADGFCKPIHDDIRNILTNSSNFFFGRATILARAADSALTLKCLESVLSRQDIRELWSYDWHTAIKAVTNEAIELLLRRARQEAGSTLSSSVIAETLYRLREQPSIDWKVISTDKTLPLTVRCAATFCTAEHSDNSQSELIDAAVDDCSKHEYIWESFSEAYTSTTWWKDHFRTICQQNKKPDHNHALEYLSSDRNQLVTDEIIDLLSEVSRAPSTNPELRLNIQGILGAIGLSDFAQIATDALTTADISEIHTWINRTPYFPNTIILQGMKIIFSRPLPVSALVEIINSLQYESTLQAEKASKTLNLAGPFKHRKPCKEITTQLITHAESLMRSEGICNQDRIKLLFTCSNAGSIQAAQNLKAALDTYLKSHEKIETKDWNNWIANFAFNHSIELETNTLWLILEKGKELPMSTIVDRIITNDGENAYQKLIDHANLHPFSSAWSGIYSYFERNAARKGLILRNVDGKLELSAPEKFSHR